MSAALVLADPEPATRGFLERHLLDDGFDGLSAEDPREAADGADLVLLGDVGALERWEPACPVSVLGAAGGGTGDRGRGAHGGGGGSGTAPSASAARGWRRCAGRPAERARGGGGRRG